MSLLISILYYIKIKSIEKHMLSTFLAKFVQEVSLRVVEKDFIKEVPRRSSCKSY